MTKDETIRELSDKIAEVEFKHTRLLRAHNRLKAKLRNAKVIRIRRKQEVFE